MADSEVMTARTAVANRTVIRRALFAIEQICLLESPTLSEIDEIQTLCDVIKLSTRKWRTAENLIITAETNRRKSK